MTTPYVPRVIVSQIPGELWMAVYRIDETTNFVRETETLGVDGDYNRLAGTTVIVDSLTQFSTTIGRGVTSDPADVTTNLAAAYIKWGVVKVKDGIPGKKFSIYDLSREEGKRATHPFYPVSLYLDTTQTAVYAQIAEFILTSLEEMIREHLTELVEEALVRQQVAFQTTLDVNGDKRRAIYEHKGRGGAPAMANAPNGVPMYRFIAQQDANKYQRIASERSVMMYDLLARFQVARQNVTTVPKALEVAESLLGLPASGFMNPHATEPWYLANFAPKGWFHGDHVRAWIATNTSKLRVSGAGASNHQMSAVQMNRLMRRDYTHTLEQSGTKFKPEVTTPPAEEGD